MRNTLYIDVSTPHNAPPYKIILVDVGGEVGAKVMVALRRGAIKASTVLRFRRALRGCDGEVFGEHLRVVGREVQSQVERLC